MRLRTLLPVAAVIAYAAIPLVAIAAHAADLPPVFVRAFGTFGAGPGQMNWPRGIDVGEGGHVFVADSGNDRLLKFMSGGPYLAAWGSYGTGPGEFKQMTGVVVAPGGEVYMSDWWNDRVQKWSAAGAYVAQVGAPGSGNGQLKRPEGLALDVAGSLYVADHDNHRVMKFNAAGAYVAQWGGAGTAAGKFNGPSGIAIDTAGVVYVSDSGNNRIQRFTTAGVYLGGWGVAGSAAGQFMNPYGLAIDASGRVYVVDDWNNRVQVFTNTGTFVAQWGGIGTGPGQFRSPEGIAIGPWGEIYVTDYQNERVQMFAPATAVPALPGMGPWILMLSLIALGIVERNRTKLSPGTVRLSPHPRTFRTPRTPAPPAPYLRARFERRDARASSGHPETRGQGTLAFAPATARCLWLRSAILAARAIHTPCPRASGCPVCTGMMGACSRLDLDHEAALVQRLRISRLDLVHEALASRPRPHERPFTHSSQDANLIGPMNPLIQIASPAAQAADEAAPWPKKLARLRAYLAELGSVVVAYSGGVDSSVVLRVAHDVLGECALGVIGRSDSYAERELQLALEQAAAFGARVEVVSTGELADPNFRSNPTNRCYHCKTELYRELDEVAKRVGAAAVLDGTIRDDIRDWRPGRLAASERGVRSPLAELGFTKADVRAVAAQFGLSSQDKPASPCLASRIPYGSEITREKLNAVEAGEDALRGLGFRELRVRHHGETVRIEVPAAEIARFADPVVRDGVVEAMKALGFTFVTLDLEGFRSGSLNALIETSAGSEAARPPGRSHGRDLGDTAA